MGVDMRLSKALLTERARPIIEEAGL